MLSTISLLKKKLILTRYKYIENSGMFVSEHKEDYTCILCNFYSDSYIDNYLGLYGAIYFYVVAKESKI